MRRDLIVAGLLLFLVLAPARAFSAWGVGANLGLTVLNPTEVGAPNITLVGVPTQSRGFGPGFRLGVTEGAMVHEAYLNVGYDSESSEGESFHILRLGGNYQYNFRGTTVRPYLTAGAGIFNFGSGSLHATTFTVGGGAGIGLPVSDDAGRFRLEARMDKIKQGENHGDVVIGETNAFQVLLGFDLWVR